MNYRIGGVSDGSVGMTATWNGGAMPSLRSSLCAYHIRSTTLGHPNEQTGRLLQVGIGHVVTINCIAIPQPVQFSPSDGGSNITVYQSGELRRSRYWINAINRDDDGEDEEEDRDGEEDIEEEEVERPSLKYSTLNDRAGGRRQAKYYLQEIGDARPASAVSRTGELNVGRTRAKAMNQRRTTLVANMRNRVQDHYRVSNVGERRRHVNPPGGANELHNHLLISQLG